jgi:cytochrome c553
MIRWIKWAGLVAVVAIAAYYARPVYVWLASEAIFDRRYTLPRSLIRADKSRDGIARGARLVRLAGCTGCHGANLLGKKFQQPIPIWASNLRALLRTYSDEDFDRGIRRGLRPDASSLWLMPSQAYVYMRDGDVAALLGYLRALTPSGRESPVPEFDRAAREKIVSGELQPIAPLAMGTMPALDLGPRYSGGRYIAMFACGVCHDTELTGSDDGSAPDLDIVTRYSRAEFFGLMRKGIGPQGQKLRIMGPLARQRFHILQDWEIDPLYAYLIARAKAPSLDQISGAIR